MVKLTKGLEQFASKIGPIVMAWEAIFKIFTFQDVQTTLIVLGLASYSIIYFEQFLWFLPAAPIGLILYIFNNLHTRSKFERPQKTPVANLKFI